MEAQESFSINSFYARQFAEWLERQFRRSGFKSYSELANRAGLQRSTVSSLVSGKPQTATGKASQPKLETVIKLAAALGSDVDESLLIAGYAPILARGLDLHIADSIRVSKTEGWPNA